MFRYLIYTLFFATFDFIFLCYLGKTNKNDEIYLIKSHVAQNQMGIIYGKLFDCEDEEEWTLKEDKKPDQGLIEVKKNYW